MKKLSSSEIRNIWLKFFESKNHKIIESAPLVPINDPSLLWINAGIAPLKKYFDGREIPENRRMANSQKSIRTNDIENVGRTARHHTFFEMLGNFSIGDYFRDEALEWAIEILTDQNYYGFDLDKLYFTIHPLDNETFNKWLSLGVDEKHIIRLEGNYWEIGEGPCGPNTEIFYDRGPKYDSSNLGIELLKNDLDNDRYIEIWNIVFSQFNAVPGVKREEYKELPSKNIDTGMGLERMACVIQEVDTNYETDLFMPIIKKTEELTNVKYTGQMSFKVIADHVRSVVFAISDGAVLSNEGRGYVLRRILRRAVRYGKKLGMNSPFMYQLVQVVADTMEDFYPYLQSKVRNVEKLIRQEEERFLMTLDNGEKKLFEFINNNKSKEITKEEAFLLYDTFGFPIELTIEIASENGISVDLDGFKSELAKQKELSRSSRVDEGSMNVQNEEMLKFKEKSIFVGYNEFSSKAEIIGIFSEGKNKIKASGSLLLVFSKTPFYAESGGQVGDIGTVEINSKLFKITNTIKLPNGQHASFVDTKDFEVKLKDQVNLSIDTEYRDSIIKNHSATHLLNESLRRVLGEHVIQQGSFVGSDSIRFDFNNYNFPTNEEIIKIEQLVNEEINKGREVIIREMPLEDARKMNVQAVFGEKYGSIVRVIDMEYSKELCGGCHVSNTKDIERFAILSVESKGSGLYRIEATTSNNIEHELERVLLNINNEYKELSNKANSILNLAKTEGLQLDYYSLNQSDILPSYLTIINRREELNILRENVKELDKNFRKLSKENYKIELDDYLQNVLTISNYNVLISKTYNLEIDILKDLVDRLSDKLKDSLVFIANNIGDKIIFVCKNKIANLHAGELVKKAAIKTGGNGGGRADFAQAGGRDVSLVDLALTDIKEVVEGKL